MKYQRQTYVFCRKSSCLFYTLNHISTGDSCIEQLSFFVILKKTIIFAASILHKQTTAKARSKLVG